MKQNTHLFAQVAMSAARGGSSSSPSAGPRRCSVSARGAPSRSTARSRRASAAWKWKSIASRSPRPLIARIRSPARSPAAAAGAPARTAATTTPSAEERVFTRFLPLLAVRRVEEAHALDDVLEAGDDRERRGGPEDRRRADRQAEVAGQEADQDREDLEERRRLSRPRRPRVDAAAQHVDEERADDEDHVAADDDGGDPERQRLEVRERDEGGGEEELVGHRVEERPQARLAPAPPRDVAVEEIRERRAGEHDQRWARLPVDEQRHE